MKEEEVNSIHAQAQLADPRFRAKQRIVGFVGAIIVFTIVSWAGVTFSERYGMVASTIVGMIGSAVSLCILIGLLVRKYSLYAQGALIAWVVYVVAAVVSSIFFV